MQKHTIKSSLLKTNEASGKRSLRIAAEIKRDLPSILRSHIVFPENIMLSIVDVVVTSDLSLAKIYVSILGQNEAQQGESAARLLNHKKGIVRSELCKLLVMRQHPDLKFYYDTTPARAARIKTLFKQIHADEPEHNSDEIK